MPTEVHNESLCTINFPRRLSRAESGWSCHLRAVAFSDPLMLVSQGEGGRREGLVLGGGNPVWPVCRYIYIPPAGGPGEAAEQPSRARSHTSTWLSVGLRFLSSKLHVCEKEGKPRLTPQRQHTSGSHFNCTPRLAVWLPSVLTIRAGGSGHLETFTQSHRCTRQCQSGWARGRGGALWLGPWRNKQVSLKPKIQSGYPRWPLRWLENASFASPFPTTLVQGKLHPCPQLAIEEVYFLGDWPKTKGKVIRLMCHSKCLSEGP